MESLVNGIMGKFPGITARSRISGLRVSSELQISQLNVVQSTSRLLTSRDIPDN
jgi:hypothetical protein